MTSQSATYHDQYDLSSTSRDLLAGSRSLARALDSANKSRNVEVKDFSCVGSVLHMNQYRLKSTSMLKFCLFL